MKTQLSLATLLLVFSYHGATAHSIRGGESHSLHRYLKSDKEKDKDNNGAYRVVSGKGKKGFESNVISFDDPAMLWLVVKKGDSKVGQCVSAISEWALDNYALDLAVVQKDPKDKAAGEDIVVFLDDKTDADECQEIANDILATPGFSEHKRGGVFDTGVQNIASFDVNTEDKKCEDDCKKDRNDCEKGAIGANALDDCKKDESSCKRDCEKDCESDCDKNWKGIFNDSCRRSC